MVDHLFAASRSLMLFGGACVLIGAVGIAAEVVTRPTRFLIPVGAEVAFLDRIVRIIEHHEGNGLNARTDPKRYIYEFVDDPPPTVVTPWWDAADRRWSHRHSATIQTPKGERGGTQVMQFNRLADYRR